MATKKERRADHQGEHRTAFDKNKARIFKTCDTCGICGGYVDVNIKNHLDPMAPVIDHIVPISRGGHPSDISNLQLAHRWCNRQKADKLFDTAAMFKSEEELGDALPLHADWVNYKAK